jgi:hypothetical protein
MLLNYIKLAIRVLTYLGSGQGMKAELKIESKNCVWSESPVSGTLAHDRH